MDLFNSLIGLIEFLVGAAVISGVLLIVLLVVVSLLPKDNPLQRLLVALTKRVAVMLGVSVAAGPFAMLLGAGEIVDVVAFAVTAWYWLSLFWEARDILSEPRILHKPPSSARHAAIARAPGEERLLLASSTRRTEREEA